MPNVAILATALTTHAAHGFSLFVAGEDVIAPVGSANKGVPLDSIRITEGGDNSAGSLSFLFEDPAKAYSLPASAEVVLWDAAQNIPLFGGFIVSRSLVPAFGQQGRSVQVTCTDYSPLLDKTLVPVFAVPAGLSDQAILQSLISNFGGRLSGLSDTIALTNASMPGLSFIGLTMRQAIETVADAAGTNRVYWVDSLKRLNYTNASALTAPFLVKDNPSGGGERAVENLTLESEDDIINAVFVRGANGAGSGWVRDTDSIRDIGSEFEAFLDAPDADTAAKRNSYAGAYLGRVRSSVVRGSFEIANADGWRPGQIVTISNAALGLVSATYQIVSVESTVGGGTGYRHYNVKFGALPRSLARLLGQESTSQISADQISEGLSAVPGVTGANGAAFIIKDLNGVIRVLLGAFGNGDFGLQVTSSDGSTVIIDGTSNMFKILASGTVSITQADNTSGVSDTTLGGLGVWTTIPICISGVSFSNTLTGNVRQLAREIGFLNMWAAPTSGGATTSGIRGITSEASVGSYVSGTDAGVRIGLGVWGNSASVTAYGRYQLCKEASL